MRLCNRFKGEIYTKERKSLSLVQRRKRESEGIYSEADKKEIYLIIKVTTNYAGIFCRKKGWEEKDSIRLSVSQ